MRTHRGEVAGVAAIRRAALCAAALACLLALASAPAARAAGWLSPQDLSAAGRDAYSAQVAMDGSGNAIAIWERGGTVGRGVYMATHTPGGGFSSSSLLSHDSDESDLATAPGGRAVVAWRNSAGGSYTIQVATRSPGGTFSAPTDVASVPFSAQPTNLDVVVNDAGDVAVVWKEGTNPPYVRACVRPSGEDFSTPETISPKPLVAGQNAGTPRVALDAGGTATAVWRYNDAGQNVVQTASRALGESNFTPPADLSASGAVAVSPALAVAPDGEMVATWLRTDGANDQVRVAFRASGGDFFSDPVDLSAPGGDAFGPEVAVNPSGEAVAVWLRDDGTDYIAQAAIRPAAGSFSTPVDLSAPGANANTPSVAVNASGAAVVAWQRSGVIQAVTRPPGGSFSNPDNLSGGSAVFPTVAIDDEGGAIATWWRENGTNTVAQAAGFDVSPPTIGGLSVPSSAVVGRLFSLSFNAFDDWGIASTSLDFGDGSTAGGTSASHTYSAPGRYRVVAAATDDAGMSTSAARTIAVRASNAFRFVRLRRIRRTGRAILVVRVAGPGRVALFGRGLRRVVRGARKAGNVRIPVLPRRRILRRLNRRHRVKVGLRVIFNPRGGPAARKARPVVLVKRPARRHRRPARK